MSAGLSSTTGLPFTMRSMTCARTVLKGGRSMKYSEPGQAQCMPKSLLAMTTTSREDVPHPACGSTAQTPQVLSCQT